MKAVFFGTSEFAVPILERLARGAFRPELVVTTPDAPAGRGHGPRSPAVKTAAVGLGIPVIQPENLSPIPYPLSPPRDLFLVAAYGKILPADLLRIPKYGALNVHPSLLPRWRGPSPVQYAILNGDQETGVTIMLMDEEVDHGPILKNLKFEIRNSKSTTPELTIKLAEVGAALLLRVIPEWLAGRIAPQPQDHARATHARLLKKEDGRIAWSKPAAEIERMVRAFQPWPGAYTFWQREPNQLRLMLEAADERSMDAEGRAAGTVFTADGQLMVQVGQEVLMVERLKPEGGRSMSGNEFLRGHRGIIGAQLR